MKKLILSSFITVILLFISTQNAFSQNIFYYNQSEIQSFLLSEKDKIPKPLSVIPESPEALTVINFDELPWDGVSHPIAPNYYPGVSFYAPYTNSYTFVRGNYGSSASFPNHFEVGTVGINGAIIWLHPLNIDFSREMKNVSLSVGSGSCTRIDVQIYGNNGLLQTVPLTWGFFDPAYKNIQLNSYSQRVRSISLYSYCTSSPGPYIPIDDVTFEPNLTSSPIGYLDSVQTSNPVGAVGWSVDP
jgi:hypothetical protein